MIISVFLKILCDCCIFFGFMGTLPDLFPNELPLIIPALGCAVSAAGAYHFRRKGTVAISVLLALLPLLLFLHDGTVREKLILIPAVLYTVMYGILGRFEMEYLTFRKEYPRNAVILFVYSLLTVILPHLFPKQLYLPDVAFWFGMLYLLSGVLLLQRLRMGNSCDQRSNWVQHATIIGSVSIAVGFSFLIKLCMRILIFFMGSVLIVEEVKEAIGYYEMQKIRYELTKDMYPSPTIPPPPQAWDPYNGAPVEPHEEVALEYRWMIIAAILFVLIVVAVIMLAKSKNHVNSKSEEVYEGSVFLFRKGKKSSNYSNRSKIRKYYREYLRIERGHGVKLLGYMTSTDILDAASARIDREAAEQLREMYVAARYRENTEITAEQVQTAKMALKQIRSSTQTGKQTAVKG